MSEHHQLCDICHQDIGTRPWVLLNRFCYGTGKCRGACEVQAEDGDCVWEVGDDLDAEKEIVSGALVCFPDCMRLYIEGKMIEADIHMGHTE